MNTLAIIPTETEFSVMQKHAQTLIKSGFLPDAIKTPEQALAIMSMGRELGIPAWQAINGINVIKGKPTVAPQLMLALVERSGQLEDITINGDDKQCTVTMTRKGRTPHSETFTFEDAKKMQTYEKGKSISLVQKFNWRTMPAVMLKWRAVSACARVVFPDVLMGMYITEEINPDAPVDENGEVVVEDKRKPTTSKPKATQKPDDNVQDGEIIDDDQPEQPAIPTTPIKNWTQESGAVDKLVKYVTDDARPQPLPSLAYFELMTERDASDYFDGREACETYVSIADDNADIVKLAIGNLWSIVQGHDRWNAKKHFVNWFNKSYDALHIEPATTREQLVERVNILADEQQAEKGSDKQSTDNPLMQTSPIQTPNQYDQEEAA